MIKLNHEIQRLLVQIAISSNNSSRFMEAAIKNYANSKGLGKQLMYDITRLIRDYDIYGNLYKKKVKQLILAILFNYRKEKVINLVKELKGIIASS